jgi:hypothetical protein
VASKKTKEAQLAELVAEAFTPDELKRFVRYGPEGHAIVDRLPALQ